ncbi:MAG: hypothetical protein ACKO4U_20905 [Caldilinea sp.]
MAQADSTGSITAVVIVDTDILSMFAKADALVWLGRLFGLEGLRLLPEITQIEDVGVLKAVHTAIRSVTRPEELRQFYAASEQ